MEIDTGKNTRAGKSTAKQTEEMDTCTTQDNTQVSNLQDKSPCTQHTTTTGQTPRSSHQLYPLTLFSAEDTVDKSCASTEAVTAASFECQMKEPEMEHTTYESKAATQICKAIGNPKILTVFDKLRVELKSKISQKVKPTHLEKQKYASVLSQVHTKILSKKYELKSTIKKFEIEHFQKHGTLPSRKTKEYDILRKNLDYVKKLVTMWHNFEL